ncbi:MAG: aminotransferase class III-fold pyridoxal phosphate-dependent enzyme, partial [Candidatus Levybacteria bacterium]|nr:aminotransferase class III-fold pyridoxal phosphate-dependent enzyme [Candidatus Levybacteria bacterium]
GNEFKGDHRVSNVRGIGMEVGVTFTDPDMMGKVVNKARENGLHLAMCGDGNIQLMPPLTIDRPILEQGIGIFLTTVRKL